MPTELGHIEAIFRYPVKSMRGEQLESAQLGWHGLDGDRRFALRRMNDQGGFPYLTASKFPGLVLFTPHNQNGNEQELPTHVRTPDGKDFPIFVPDLAAEIDRRHGAPVEMMQFKNGIFDDACISVIASDTIHEIGRLAGRNLDIRRFRPNIVVRLHKSGAFKEDSWLGGTLSFGDSRDAPAISVTMRDVRCSMVNLDPDTAAPAPEILKTIVRVNDNNAGIYATVTRTGRLSVGQKIFLKR